MGSKKHKKHKSEKRDRYEDKQLGTVEKPPALKLILKVGSSSTPEHSDSPGPSVSNYSVATTSFIEEAEEEEVDKDSLLVRTDGHRRVFDEGGGAVRQGSEDNSRLSIQAAGGAGLGSAEGSRRIVASGTVMGGLGGSEERHRRAKKKKKKRERDKHEKRHKHHHKEKRKRMRGGSSQEDDVESGMVGSHRRREGGEMSIGVHDGGGHRVASETSANAGTYVGGTVPSGVQVAGASVGSVNSPSSQHLPPPAKRPCLQQTPQGQYGEPLAANQGSANLEGSSSGNVMGQPASQTASSTPAGNNSAGANQQGNNAAALGSREPRSCVLRQRQQERAPLQRLLEHLLRTLERRDPHHFFAWPVTDSIAPGYSRIIRRPMDFSTMKQKIDEGMYATLGEYVEDFKLMCNNAMVYNHPDTIYYKAAKRLLHVGLRTMTPEKIRPLASVLPSLARLTRRELGFELNLPPPPQPPQQTASANVSAHGVASGDAANVKQEGEDEVSMEGVVEGGVSNDGEQRVGNEEGDEDYEDNEDESRRDKRRSMRTKPGSKFEAIADDMTPEEILAQAKKAASDAAQKLSLKRAGAKMGFLRQRRDGTTSLAVLIPGDGVTPGSNEKPVSLGALVGKLTHGTGQLQGFREDRRNAAKTVKPLYYGSFGSYAPSYDSTFANLTKDESDLVYSTYGDETAVQYAESILDFAKDCDYALKMVDNLLDIVTGGEHRRTMRTIEEHRRKTRGEGDDEGGRYKRYLLEAEKNASNAQGGISDGLSPKPSVNSSDPTSASTGNSADPYDVKIDFEALKTLSDVGIDVSFLDNVENDIKNEALQRGLDQTGDLIGKLEQVQRERLSQPPPAHLALVAKPSEIEVQLAEKITENLTDMAKKVTPEAIAPLPVLRKAMGISPPVSSGKLSTVTSTGNPSMSLCEEIADDEDEESEVSGSRLSRPDPSASSAPPSQNGTAPSEIKSSMDESIIKSDESRLMASGNLSTETEGIVSKLQEDVLKEVNLEDSHLDQPMKVEEGLPAKKVCEDEKSLTLKEEIAESSVADQGLCPPLGTAVDVGAGEPGNILISEIKVESTDPTGMESCSAEKDNVLFGKDNEIITKQDMVVSGDHMASDCIIGGNEDNVLGSITGLGDATCAELGAILAGSENKSDLSKVQVESGRISDVSGVQGSLVSEGIGLVTGTVSSNLAGSVTASGHMPSTSASMVRSANSLVAGRGGTSGGGMSVVVVEAGGVVEEVEVPDLESELREFLENEPALGGSPLQDDKTIEEILSES